MISAPDVITRADRVQTALRLEGLTLMWMVLEACSAIGGGVRAHSVLLLAFGVDSVIELISACLLYYRLTREAKALPTEGADIERLERSAARIGGYLLYALALYVIAQSGYGLLHRHQRKRPLSGLRSPLPPRSECPCWQRQNSGLRTRSEARRSGRMPWKPLPAAISPGCCWRDWPQMRCFASGGLTAWPRWR